MPSNNRNQDLIRMAVLFQKRQLESNKLKPLILPEPKWTECERLARLHQKAIDKGWLAAAALIRRRFHQALQEFQTLLAQTRTEQDQPTPLPSSLGKIYAELLGLYDEFPNADLNLRLKTISVITDSVTLEDVYLGPFSIELDVASGNGLSYSVIATDANPAGNDEDVTHPHVRDNCLCEGEGTLPIRHALEEGRFGDFFQIVDQILQTYNSGSAYIALDEWQGISCTACGEYVNDDERTSCSRTSDTLCCECAVTCPDCDQDFAPDLVEHCEKCEESFCDRCLDEGMCHACHKETCEEETEQQAQASLGGCGGRSAGLEQAEAVGPAIR